MQKIHQIKLEVLIKQAKKMHKYLKTRIISEKIGVLLYSPVPAPIDKTKKIVNNDIDRKTKTIYLNSQMLNRIKPLLKEMEDADMTIKKMDKKLIQGLVTK